MRCYRFCSDMPFGCTGIGHELAHARFLGLEVLVLVVGLGYLKPHFAVTWFCKPSGATMMEIGFCNLRAEDFHR